MQTQLKNFQQKQLGFGFQNFATSPKLQRKQKVQAQDRPLWYPGNPPPSWLDGSLPADYGFDPLALGSDKGTLRWFREAELNNSRWAMLGVAGMLLQEVFTGVDWYSAGEYYAKKPGSIPNIVLIVAEFIFFFIAEHKRVGDFRKPGSQGDGSVLNITDDFKSKEVGYPGGKFFDPLSFSKTSPERWAYLKESELKNGRLAMLAFYGLICQKAATGKSPLQNLSDHIANPGYNNFATNGLSLPFST